MNIGAKVLGQSVEFSVNTSHPETLAEADADANPTFGVYEYGADTPALVTGNMGKRDDSNTVGYYRGAFTPQSVGGFEVGKFYEIRIRAVVAGVPGNTSRYFNLVSAAEAAGSPPAAGLGPITAANVFSHLLGLEKFLTLAAAEGYNETFVNARIIPAVLREFERAAQFRLSPIQVVCGPDGTYTSGKVVEEQPYHYFRSKSAEFLATNLKYRPIQQVQRLRIF